MNFLPRITPIAALVAALSLLVAGCGGSSSTDSTAAGQTSKPTTVAAAEVSGLGDVLVDAEGFTVYSFGKDQGTTSSCYGACEKAWPPVLVKGAPSVGEGAETSELGTTKRKDGSTQATYAGHPLYTFFEDDSPGEANGNGVDAFGGIWNALGENGEAAGESSETVSGGGGY